MPLQARSHDSPTKAWSVAHGNIGVLHAQHVLLNQAHYFTIKRCLEPVTDMAGKLFFQIDRFLSDSRVKRHCLSDCVGRCLRSSDDFDQWNDVWWIERVPDDDPFRVSAF